MPDSIKTRFMKLSLSKKLVLIGSFLVVIGAFLPWYQDIDKFKNGDMFLGITGPLYLAGLIVLLAGGASFTMILFKLMNKPAPKLPMREDHFHILLSSLSVFMLVLATSVFFHNKFGVNLIDKNMGIGMVFAFIGAGLVFAGGIMVLKKKDVSFDTEGHIEKLINMDSRVTQSLDKEKSEINSALQESLEEFSMESSNTNDIKHDDR